MSCIFYCILLCLLKCGQTLVLPASDDSFYMYDDGSAKPFEPGPALQNNILSKQSVAPKNFESAANLNEEINLYKKIGAELQKNLDAFRKTESQYDTNVRKARKKTFESDKFLEASQQNIEKKSIQSEEPIYTNALDLKSEYEKSSENEKNASLVVNDGKTQTEAPTLLQKIKEKWDNVFQRSDGSQDGDYGAQNVERRSPAANETNINKNGQTFSTGEFHILKNFVKFVMDANSYAFNNNSANSKNGRDKGHSKENNAERKNHKTKPGAEKDFHTNVSNQKIPPVDSVNLNISVSELEDGLPKQNKPTHKNTKPNKNDQGSKDATKNPNGCPLNFNNMNIEMEIMEEESNAKPQPDCKLNLKDMKAKINIKSRPGRMNNKSDILNPSSIKLEHADSEQKEQPFRLSSVKDVDEKMEKVKATELKDKSTSDAFLSDVSQEELKRFKELIERRLLRMESSRKLPVRFASAAATGSKGESKND